MRLRGERKDSRAAVAPAGARRGHSLLSGRLRSFVLSLPEREVSFSHRGFHWDREEVRRHLEGVAHAFRDGYQAAVEDPSLLALAARLDAVPEERRGFAYEGAGMCLAILDSLTPWNRDRLVRLLEGPGAPFVYLVHVGVGFALARLPLPFAPRFERLRRLDPILSWLALDGYGFHAGFFHPRRSFAGRRVPRPLAGYARRAFDQGLGRSLWFVEGANASRIASTIAGFVEPRRADLWSGVGLACVYAAGGDPAAVRCAAAGYEDALAQGAAFAAKARLVPGFVPEAGRQACFELTGRTVEAAAEICDACGIDLPADGEVPAFEAWRRRIQLRLTEPQEARWLQSVS